jgi:tetratricopeptide (TPR) repeat protein/predicted Ser/Thr protein kinase
MASQLTPQRWEQIRKIFEEALDLDPGGRSAFLDRCCASDGELRIEVESLLAQHMDEDSVLDRPVWENPAVLTAISGGPWLPRRIGHYRIVRLLGEGGMGSVYEAEQDQPRRLVALKVIRTGQATAELLRRFELESEALARLQHPGIAQVYEAGTSDEGFGPQPYFAMEFIQGQTLREFAAERAPDIRQRLELMARICDAVEHAHQHGIIHRDLKPGNILVDKTGQPKVVDFGVARVTDADARATQHTDLGQLVGTLAYMSPEQVLGNPLLLDTRSDVYALGVILYELLAGRLPYTLSLKLHEAVHTIREGDPAPLSSISRVFRGDVETIVSKALEKDKTRRYGSASALAEDIRRYLREEPILARAPSASYQLQKFARRHKALVVSVAVVFVVLTAGVVASTLEAVRARRAERLAVEQLDRADRESATAKAVSEFLQNDVLAQADPGAQASPDASPDPNLKVRVALDRAAARIAGKFDRQPLVEAAIRQTISDTYRDLGLFPEALHQAEQALAIRRKVLGEEARDTLTSLNQVAGLYDDQGNYQQSEALYVEVHGIAERTLGEGDPLRLTNMNDLGQLYLDEGKYSSAEPLLAKGLEISLRTTGEDDPGTLSSMHNLAYLYRLEGRFAEAETLYERVLKLRERVLGGQHPGTLLSMNNLAMLYSAEGKYDRAQALLSQALEIQRRIYGPEHPDTLSSMDNLGWMYARQGKYARAEALIKAALAIWIRRHGEEYPETLNSMHALALTYFSEGRYAQSGALFGKVLDVERRVLGAAHPHTLDSMTDLGVSYRSQGRYAEAESLLTRALEAQRRVLGPDHPDTLRTMQSLAGCYRMRGKYAMAEPLLAKVLEVRRRVPGPEDPSTTDVMDALGELWLQQLRFRDAEPLLREAFSLQTKKNPGGWNRYYSQSLLGASLAGLKKFSDAEPLLLSGYEGMAARVAPVPMNSRETQQDAGERILRLYELWEKPDRVQEWKQKLQASASLHVSNNPR